MCITVDGADNSDGLNIVLQTYTGEDNQLFKIVQDGAFYGIVSKVSGDTVGLDVYGWLDNNGGVINQWNYWGGDGQKFILEPALSESVAGDVNADGNFSVADVVMMQKWLLGSGDMTDRKAGDLHKDDIIDVFDLVLMKQK